MESLPLRPIFCCLRWVTVLGVLVWATLCGDWSRAAPKTTPSPGLRENPATFHALEGARIHVRPDLVVQCGTIVIKDGMILAAGADVATPPGARRWDYSGKTIYAGFIDAYGEAEAALPPSAAAGYWNPEVVPQLSVADTWAPDAELHKTLRAGGFTARLIAPAAGVIRGVSALVTTADAPTAQTIMVPEVALHVTLTAMRKEGERNYPNSPMGAMTLARQAWYDAKWYRDALAAYQGNPTLPRPEQNAALAALGNYLDPNRPVIVEASDEWYALRADQVGRELGLNVILHGSGREYRRLDAVRGTGRAVIVPLAFPLPPNVLSPEAARSVSMESLLHWDLAPENPGKLVAAGVKIALSTHGLKDRSSWLAELRKAVARGLPPAVALAALTVTPAELFGVANRLGTIEPGKAAHLVVADGDLFAGEHRVTATWIDGIYHEVEPLPVVDLRGNWELRLALPDGGSEAVRLLLEGEPRNLSGTITRGERSAKLRSVVLDRSQLIADGPATDLGWQGHLQLSATVLVDPPPAGADPITASGARLAGQMVLADGRNPRVTGVRVDAAATPMPPAPPAEQSDKPAMAANAPALYPVTYPLSAFGVDGPPETPAAVVFRHATVWTCGPQGILNDGSVLVENGKIIAVGGDLTAPAGAVEVDASGKHLTPGIVDCHSHIATDGGVNESGQTITAEVRIGDFIDANDVNIYRQLAGGVTAANILHGSANTIGGQNQVIKFRWGALPEDMKFAAAPPGIKFALGENVKQSNWGDQFKTRYPQSRMGVEQLVRDAFQAARDYRRAWDAWRANPIGIPPRLDLELEALAEVLAGTRLIHCHSYRQDEILAFLRTCEAFGVRVRTLQHILEGYKLADVMVRHGVGGSSFSDWWAYKFEVYDAIPYNGALMHAAGVLVSYNSDDPELARHLNLEAAKAVHYGGVPEIEALKFVTLNPAAQLGIDAHVGSLEAGKDADLVVWSGPPLSSYARCEQTWIDGRKYFDVVDDAARRERSRSRRLALVQKILATGGPFADPDDQPRSRWPRDDVFCGHGHDEEGHE